MSLARLARLAAGAALGCAASGALGALGALGAQRRPTSYAEYRADVIAGSATAAQAGGGLVLPFGVYVRTSLDGAIGATWRGGVARTSGRADVISRFLLDPFRETPVVLSMGGGVSVPYADGDTRVRPYLTVVVDVEGRQHGAITPALQVGLGGGLRVGVVLRTSPRAWR